MADRTEYKTYVLKSPHVDHPDKLAAATEKKLLDDLASMDEQGWEIAFVFPSGSHVLMKRSRPDWPKWDPKKQDDGDKKRDPGGIVDKAPQEKVAGK